MSTISRRNKADRRHEAARQRNFVPQVVKIEGDWSLAHLRDLQGGGWLTGYMIGSVRNVREVQGVVTFEFLEESTETGIIPLLDDWMGTAQLAEGGALTDVTLTQVCPPF